MPRRPRRLLPLRLVLMASALAAVAAAIPARADVDPPDLIFQDDFESGDLSHWSWSATGGGDLSVSPRAALAQTTEGMEAVVSGAAGLYVEDLSPQAETRYKARFWFDPDGFDPGEASGHFRARLFVLLDDGGTRRLSALVLRRQAGEYSLMQRCRQDDGSRADSAFVSVSDAPHWVVMEWRSASTATSTDGLCALTVDGTTVSTMPALQNHAGTVGRARLGVMSIKAGAAGTVFFDEFVSRRTGTLGAIVSAVP